MGKAVRVISGSTSLVLDTLRIIAALTVLIYHAYDQWFPSSLNTISLSGNAAHTAVIVFFVLSGYLISHATARTKDISTYAEARLSRLCSVVIPALLITLIAQIVVQKIDPVLGNNYTRGALLPRYLISMSFLNEIWFFSAAPPINSPLWSLSYEFWYYVIFGLWIYIRKDIWGFLLLLGACLIAGPKILIMMPIWLAGSAAYNLKRPSINNKLAWLMVAIALSFLILSIVYLPVFPYTIGKSPLFFSNQFITDYVLGFIIAVSLWILPSGNNVKGKSIWIERYRIVADLTFPLYVLHFPLLVLYRAMFLYHVNNAAQMWNALFAVMIVSLIMGYFMEQRRPLWIKFFRWQFNLIRIKSKPGKVPSNKIYL
jgi:peptidoglycan/LPS O-acetylase OafA/YrhL